MVHVFRRVPHITLFCVIFLTLTRCSSMSAKDETKSKWTSMIPATKTMSSPAKMETAEAITESEGPEFEPEFRLDEVRRDVGRQTAKQTAAAPQATEPTLPRLPVKRLIPEWSAIAPDGAIDGESDNDDALPRHDQDTDELPGSMKRLAGSQHYAGLPGTVVESTSEDLDEIYAASAHLAGGRIDRALVALQRFLDSDPRHAYADRANRMIVQAHIAADEWSMAIAAANRLAASFPGTFAAADAVRLRAKALQALGLPVARSADSLR